MRCLASPNVAPTATAALAFLPAGLSAPPPDRSLREGDGAGVSFPFQEGVGVCEGVGVEFVGVGVVVTGGSFQEGVGVGVCDAGLISSASASQHDKTNLARL